MVLILVKIMENFWIILIENLKIRLILIGQNDLDQDFLS